MLFKNHVFKLLLAFIGGLITAHYLVAEWVLTFTIWSIFFAGLLLLVSLGRTSSILRPWIGFSLIAVFFSSGMLGYSSHLPLNFSRHYTKEFLPGDQIICSVVEHESGKGDYDKVIIEAEHVVSEFRKIAVEGKILCYVKKEVNEIAPGSLFLIAPDLQPIKNNNNPGEFNAETYWKTQGIEEMTFLKESNVLFLERGVSISTFWHSSREFLKRKYFEYLEPENHGVAVALTLGDKSSLSKERRDAFAEAGAMHVLAVSGMHVGILLGFLQWIFYKIPFMRKRNVYILSALVIVWCFAFLTGLSASVFRAALMFSILAVGQLRGYSFFSLNAILFSGLILLIIDPFYLFNIGFQLSFLAMLGIHFFYGSVKNLLDIPNKWVNYFWQGTAIGVAAQIGTAPLSLYYFNQFPNYFLITNVGLLVLAAVALISAIVFFSFSWIPFITDILAEVVNFIFSVLNGFVEWIHNLPFAISSGFNPSGFYTLLLYVGIAALLYFTNVKNLIGFRLSCIFVFILGIGLIFNREKNILADQLVVFNHFQKLVVLKEDKKMFCFYDMADEKALERVAFMTEGYKKQMGAESDLIPVSKGKEIKISDFFSLRTTEYGWEIEYSDKSLLLLDKNVSQEKANDFLVIKGAWNQYISPDNIDVSTEKEAYILNAEN